MSNLSELLPAGAGAKSATFVASGTLASGVTVALKSNGQVEAIASVGQSIGAESVFETATSNYSAATYDSNSNKVVIAYQDAGNSDYGTAVVGTVSGASISFGTPVAFTNGDAGGEIALAFDSSSNKVVIAYINQQNSYYGTAIVGTVSGTSISFGTAVVFESATAYYIGSTFDSTNNKIVLSYRDAGNSDYGTAIVGTVSGTSISFGSAVVFESATTNETAATYDSTNGRIVIAYSDTGNSGYGTAIVGTVSGTSISFGSAVVFETAVINSTTATYDSSSNKIVITYSDGGNSYYGTAIVGTVSGTSISFGTAVVFNAANTQQYTSATFDSTANKVVIAYTDTANSSHGAAIAGTVSGTSISFGTTTVTNAAVTYYNAATYDSTNNKVVIGYRDAGNSNYGTAVVLTVASSNSTDFLGITDEAISSAASGSVIVQGGVITNTNLTVSPAVITVGSKVVFDDAGPTTSISSAYDSDNNKIVHVFCTTTANAIVGTVSGTSITYGSAVQINTDSSSNTSVAYDTANDKFVIAYRGASFYGYAVVGTVSGTSISFGTPVVFYSGTPGKISVVYDVNAGKTLIMHTTGDSSTDRPTGIVGTVSGTSISFGSPTEASSNRFFQLAAAYDANAQKTVVVGADYSGTSGAAFVATISSTSVSFGSAATFLAEAVENNALAITYDSTQNKVIVVYGRNSNDYGYYTIGTVSGTSVSFTTGVEFIGNGSNYYSAAYDSVKELVGVTYNSWSSSDVRFITGSVSGASISFNASNQLATSATDTSSATYDVASGNFIGSYGDGSNNSDGTSNVVLVVTSLTIGTDYFVQGDGTLSTTSSTVPAGRALSTSSILLEG